MKKETFPFNCYDCTGQWIQLNWNTHCLHPGIPHHPRDPWSLAGPKKEPASSVAYWGEAVYRGTLRGPTCEHSGWSVWGCQACTCWSLSCWWRAPRPEWSSTALLPPLWKSCCRSHWHCVLPLSPTGSLESKLKTSTLNWSIKLFFAIALI